MFPGFVKVDVSESACGSGRLTANFSTRLCAVCLVTVAVVGGGIVVYEVVRSNDGEKHDENWKGADEEDTQEYI